MFVDRLTFREVDEICSKILPILLNNHPKAEELLKTKTVVMLDDYIEVVLYLHKGIASIYLKDFSIQTSWEPQNLSTAIHEYRVMMAKNKRFNSIVLGKETNLYLKELDLFIKDQYSQLYKNEIKRVAEDLQQESYKL